MILNINSGPRRCVELFRLRKESLGSALVCHSWRSLPGPPRLEDGGWAEWQSISSQQLHLQLFSLQLTPSPSHTRDFIHDQQYDAANSQQDDVIFRSVTSETAWHNWSYKSLAWVFTQIYLKCLKNKLKCVTHKLEDLRKIWGYLWVTVFDGEISGIYPALSTRFLI